MTVKMIGKTIFIIGFWGIGEKNVYSYDVSKEELSTEETACVDAKIKNNELGIKNSNGWTWYDINANN